MLHAYLPVGRLAVFERALSLVDRLDVDVWALEQADIRAARALWVRAIRTYDRALAAAFGSD